MNRSRHVLFGAAETWDVRDIVAIPAELTDAVHKCRVVYDTLVRRVEIVPYHRRSIRSLKLVTVPPEFEYAHKYADRTALERLYAQRGACDDILIVRDGQVTDTSFSNIALSDGTAWYTPARPLLRGVRVTSLLARGFLREAAIGVQDLGRFCSVLLLNALLGPEDGVEVPVENIRQE